MPNNDQSQGAAALAEALALSGCRVPEDATPDQVVALAAEHLTAIATALAEASGRAPFTPEEVRQMSRESEEAVAELQNGPAGDVRAVLSEIRDHLNENLETEAEMESEGSVYERGLVRRLDAILALGASAGEPLSVLYRNWRGETALRTLTPRGIWHGVTDWHPEPQWLLSAFDHDKDAMRDFALADFLGAPRDGS